MLHGQFLFSFGFVFASILGKHQQRLTCIKYATNLPKTFFPLPAIKTPRLLHYLETSQATFPALVEDPSATVSDVLVKHPQANAIYLFIRIL